MSEPYIKIRYSQLNTGAVGDELLKRYELAEPVECRFYRSGMNDVYIVKTANGVYYLRISLAGAFERRDYEEETFIINTLRENGIRAAVPVRCRDGGYVWAINVPEGIRYGVLFEEAKNNPSGDNAKMAYNVGRMTAQMHGISDEKGFSLSRPKIDFDLLVEKPLSLIRPLITNRREDYDFLCGASEKLYKHIDESLSCEKPYYGFCHGDIQYSNVFFTGEDPEIFDFDCMGYCRRAYDVAVFIFNSCPMTEKYTENSVCKSFLEGYNSVRQLSDAEMGAVGAYVRCMC
jgi:Ser/Thr protein kinase RdoA (MazF antagonist)